MSEFLKELTGSEIAQEGYYRLPGGLIIQWGNTPSVASSAQTTVPFNMEFPNGFFQVVATGGSNGNTASASGYTVERNGLSKADFILRNWGGGNLLAAGSWIAIGW